MLMRESACLRERRVRACAEALANMDSTNEQAQAGASEAEAEAACPAPEPAKGVKRSRSEEPQGDVEEGDEAAGEASGGEEEDGQEQVEGGTAAAPAAAPAWNLGYCVFKGPTDLMAWYKNLLNNMPLNVDMNEVRRGGRQQPHARGARTRARARMRLPRCRGALLVTPHAPCPALPCSTSSWPCWRC